MRGLQALGNYVKRAYGRRGGCGWISSVTQASRTAMRRPDGRRVWAKNRPGPRYNSFS